MQYYKRNMLPSQPKRLKKLKQLRIHNVSNDRDVGYVVLAALGCFKIASTKEP